MSSPRNAEFDPTHGVAETLAPGLRRILAPNPSPMTYRGTNTYMLGEQALAVIDPGPLGDDHLNAILGAVGPDQHIAAILVTHSHRDHSPLAAPLAQATDAPVYGFGPSHAGRSAVMVDLAAAGLTGGGEGVDPDFAPTDMLGDGAPLRIGPDTITALWTPGHMGNHLCFVWRDALFCGDVVMGWASTMVSPPDGDLAAFYDTCAKLSTRPEPVFYPAHGAPIQDPGARIQWLIQNRRNRETQIRAALGDGPSDLTRLTQRVYTDVNPMLLPAAARNVLAHLIDMHGRAEVTATPNLSVTAQFALRHP